MSTSQPFLGCQADFVSHFFTELFTQIETYAGGFFAGAAIGTCKTFFKNAACIHNWYTDPSVFQTEDNLFLFFDCVPLDPRTVLFPVFDTVCQYLI